MFNKYKQMSGEMETFLFILLIIYLCGRDKIWKKVLD